MNYQRIVAIAARIIRQFLHDRRTLGLVVGAPIFILLLLGAVLKADRVFDVGLVNNDQGVVMSVGPVRLSESIGRQIEAIDGINWHQKDLDRAKADTEEGKLDGYLLFGEDFSRNILDRQQPSISLVLEGSDPASARGIAALLSQHIEGVFADYEKMDFPVTYRYGGPDFSGFDFIAPVIIAFFAFFFVFLLTSVSFLRERSQGTMERLLASPASNTEIVLGYLLGFSLFAFVQSILVLLFTVYVLNAHFLGSVLAIFLVEFVLVVGAVNLGIFLSAFARNELQVVQFIPLVITPQVLLAGVFWPVKSMPDFLQWIASVLPLTYANDALRALMIRGAALSDVWFDLLLLLAFAFMMIVLAGVSMRKGV